MDHLGHVSVNAVHERILFDTYGPADPSPQLEQILDLLVTDAVHIARIS